MRKFVSFAIISFLFWAFFFTMLKSPISYFNSSCLALTGEIRIKKIGKEFENKYTFIQERKKLLKRQDTFKKLTSRRNKSRQKKKGATKNRKAPKKLSIDYSKPKLTKLPKTEMPKILLNNKTSGSMVLDSFTFPDVRKHDGKKWELEKTEIHAQIKDNKLFLVLRCSDKEPDKLVTKYSEKHGPSASYRDDSIEVFIMKNRDAEYYCQYVCSATGKNCTNYCLGKEERPNAYQKIKIPEGFKAAAMSAKIFPNGYDIHMQIDLGNVDIKAIRPGDEILMQVVRNYRGQGTKISTTLQLFPSHIYSDNRLGINNHDRRSFQPVRIVDK